MKEKGKEHSDVAGEVLGHGLICMPCYDKRLRFGGKYRISH